MVRNRHSPEHIVGVDVRIVVVDLLRQVSRSNWTGVEVQSHKAEGTLMQQTARPDEVTLIEAHIRLKGQVCCGAG